MSATSGWVGQWAAKRNRGSKEKVLVWQPKKIEELAAPPPEQAARQGIESLADLTWEGAKRSVPLAVWMELKRTCTMSLEDVSHAVGLSEETKVSVAWVEEKSGCRLDIERKSCEVRIVGSNAGTEVAIHLVDDMAALCSEDSVPVQDVRTLTSPVLESIAYACGATLFVQGSSIQVLGLKTCVRNSVEQLLKFLAMPQSYTLPEKLEKAPASAASTAADFKETEKASSSDQSKRGGTASWKEEWIRAYRLTVNWPKEGMPVPGQNVKKTIETHEEVKAARRGAQAKRRERRRREIPLEEVMEKIHNIWAKWFRDCGPDCRYCFEQ